MPIAFSKYHGTGNDFILIDDRLQVFPVKNNKLIAEMCSRRFGIGADGLILLREDSKGGFRMVYFNSDGNESTMCGNGGRCLVSFAAGLGIANKSFEFDAADGKHYGTMEADGNIGLTMNDVVSFQQAGDDFVIDTGSPHYIVFSNNLDDLNLIKEAKAIRYSEKYSATGINVNFVEEKADGELIIRTYERGVEDETLSCGTGVVAASLAYAVRTKQSGEIRVIISSKGGRLEVHFKYEPPASFNGIVLSGPAQFVFSGTYPADP